MNKAELQTELLKTNAFNNDENLNKYIEIILQNQDRKKNENGYTEGHHIIPQCLKHTNKTKVNLLYSDHIKAHFYLACACKEENKETLISIIAAIRSFDFINTKYIDQNKLKFINKDELLNVKLFLKTNFDKIQQLKQEQQRLINEREYQRALTFYDECNRKLWKTRDINSINKEKYWDICNRHNFNNQWQEIHYLLIKRFYWLVSYYIINKYSFYKIGSILKINEKTVRTKYAWTCKKLKVKKYGNGFIPNNITRTKLSKMRINKSTLQNNFETFEKIYKLRKKDNTWAQIKQTLFLKEKISIDGIKWHYYRLCKRHPEWLKKENN